MAVDKLTLSGSTDGRGIKVAVKASTDSGTLLHTGPSVDTSYDEVWLYAMNSGSTVNVKIVIQWGGTTNPDDLYEYTMSTPESGLHLITSGLIIRGNSTPLEIRATCDPINQMIIFGYINRIS